MKKFHLVEEKIRKYGETSRAFIAPAATRLQQVKDEVAGAVQTHFFAESKEVQPEALPEPESDPETSRLDSAIEKLRGRDKVGVAAELGAGIGGTAIGVAVAGHVAAVAGVSSLFGSTTLAAVFGGVFVTATPVGWVLGSAAAIGSAAYVLAKLAGSGAKQDVVRRDLIERLTARLQARRAVGQLQAADAELQRLIAITLAADLITEEHGRRLVEMIERGSMSAELASTRLRDMALEAGLIQMDR